MENRFKETRGITMSSSMFNEDRTRRFAQLDHNLEDCHNKKSWITGETIKGRGYIQITLQSGDKLRVYDDSKNGKHQVQFSGHNNRWSIVFNGTEDIEGSKNVVLQCYTRR